jgi:hypothetical protein
VRRSVDPQRVHATVALRPGQFEVPPGSSVSNLCFGFRRRGVSRAVVVTFGGQRCEGRVRLAGRSRVAAGRRGRSEWACTGDPGGFDSWVPDPILFV